MLFKNKPVQSEFPSLKDQAWPYRMFVKASSYPIEVDPIYKKIEYQKVKKSNLSQNYTLKVASIIHWLNSSTLQCHKKITKQTLN